MRAGSCGASFRFAGLLWLSVMLTGAAQSAPNGPVIGAVGSTAFCLYELPDEAGKRRWINLGIVQFVEATPAEFKIAYGGGSFGSGYEVKIPLATAADAASVLERMRKAAAECH